MLYTCVLPLGKYKAFSAEVLFLRAACRVTQLGKSCSLLAVVGKLAVISCQEAHGKFAFKWSQVLCMIAFAFPILTWPCVDPPLWSLNFSVEITALVSVLHVIHSFMEPCKWSGRGQDGWADHGSAALGGCLLTLGITAGKKWCYFYPSLCSPCIVLLWVNQINLAEKWTWGGGRCL